MSTTIMKVSGEVRKTEVSVESFDKHRDVIIAYCNGADIEFLGATKGWCRLNGPLSSYINQGEELRIAQRKPQPGEVWLWEGVPVLAGYNQRLLRLTDGQHVDLGLDTAWDNLTYAAPSLKAYYAREFRAETQRRLSKSGDTISPLKDTLLGVVIEAAEEVTSK